MSFKRKINIFLGDDSGVLTLVHNTDKDNYQFFIDFKKESKIEGNLTCGHKFKDYNKLREIVASSNDYPCIKCKSHETFISNCVLNEKNGDSESKEQLQQKYIGYKPPPSNTLVNNPVKILHIAINYNKSEKLPQKFELQLKLSPDEFDETKVETGDERVIKCKPYENIDLNKIKNLWSVIIKDFEKDFGSYAFNENEKNVVVFGNKGRKSIPDLKDSLLRKVRSTANSFKLEFVITATRRIKNELYSDSEDEDSDSEQKYISDSIYPPIKILYIVIRYAPSLAEYPNKFSLELVQEKGGNLSSVQESDKHAVSAMYGLITNVKSIWSSLIKYYVEKFGNYKSRDDEDFFVEFTSITDIKTKKRENIAELRKFFLSSMHMLMKDFALTDPKNAKGIKNELNNNNNNDNERENEFLGLGKKKEIIEIGQSLGWIVIKQEKYDSKKDILKFSISSTANKPTKTPANVLYSLTVYKCYTFQTLEDALNIIEKKIRSDPVFGKIVTYISKRTFMVEATLNDVKGGIDRIILKICPPPTMMKSNINERPGSDNDDSDDDEDDGTDDEDLLDYPHPMKDNHPHILQSIPYVGDITEETKLNSFYRDTLYTGQDLYGQDGLQNVLMCLKPMEDIDWEKHDDNSQQFLFIIEGEGIVEYSTKEDTSRVKRDFYKGFGIIIPSGYWHRIINTSKTKDLKLFTLYTKKEHDPKTIQLTKDDITEEGYIVIYESEPKEGVERRRDLFRIEKFQSLTDNKLTKQKSNYIYWKVKRTNYIYKKLDDVLEFISFQKENYASQWSVEEQYQEIARKVNNIITREYPDLFLLETNYNTIIEYASETPSNVNTSIDPRLQCLTK